MYFRESHLQKSLLLSRECELLLLVLCLPDRSSRKVTGRDANKIFVSTEGTTHTTRYATLVSDFCRNNRRQLCSKSVPSQSDIALRD